MDGDACLVAGVLFCVSLLSLGNESVFVYCGVRGGRGLSYPPPLPLNLYQLHSHARCTYIIHGALSDEEALCKRMVSLTAGWDTTLIGSFCVSGFRDGGGGVLCVFLFIMCVTDGKQSGYRS